MRVTTFNRTFPVKHPRAAQPTHFIEKIWKSLYETRDLSMSRVLELSTETGVSDIITLGNVRNYLSNDVRPKGHTIRAGKTWPDGKPREVGDVFKPVVWSGKPYASKQLQFAPPIEVKQLWDVDIRQSSGFLMIFVDNWAFYGESENHVSGIKDLEKLATNDGLTVEEFKDWFKIHPKNDDLDFTGQIICWNENINY